jgi:hypothetical protein
METLRERIFSIFHCSMRLPLNSKTIQTKLLEQLSAADAAIILERLSERIKTAMIARATEIEYPFA